MPLTSIILLTIYIILIPNPMLPLCLSFYLHLTYSCAYPNSYTWLLLLLTPLPLLFPPPLYYLPECSVTVCYKNEYLDPLGKNIQSLITKIISEMEA